MKTNKFLVSIISILLIYTIVGFIAIPKIAKPEIEKLINENITQKASIEKIEFNPFLLKFALNNFKISNDKETTFSLKRVSIDFSLLKSIDKKHIHFKDLKIIEPYINVIENTDGSFNLEKLVKQTPKEEEEPKKETSSEIKFQIFKTVIENAKIDFTKLDSKKEPYKLSISNFNYTFYDMGTFKNALASHTLAMKINKDTILDIKGGLRLIPFEMYGNAKIVQLKPKEFLDYDKSMLNFDINKDSFIDLAFGYKVNMIKDLKIEIDHAKLDLNNLNIKKEKDNLISLKSLNINDFNLNYPQNEVSIENITFNTINSNIKSDKKGVFNFSNLVKENTQTKEQAQTTQKEEAKPWKVSLNEFNINNSNINFTDLKNSLSVATKDINLKLEKFKFENEQISLDNLNLSKIDLSLNQGKSTNITAKNISFDTKNFNFKQNNIKLDSAKFLVQNLNLKDKTNFMDAKINNISLLSLGTSYVNEELGINKLVLKNPSVSLSDLKNKQTIKAKNIDFTVEKISQKDNQIKIVKSLLNKPFIQVSLDKKPEQAKEEEKEKTQTIKKEQVKSESKSNFNFDIGPVKIKNMQMSFEDKNLPIPFKTNVTNLNGEFSRFNSNSSKPTKLNLEGKVDKYGYTKITGVVDINDIKLLTDTNLLFKNIAIKNFTPYSGKFIGKKIDSGKLNLDLKYNIKKSDLKAQNSIVINDIELGDTVESKDALNLPLDLAIALLEDSDGVIDIDLPITGNVDDPQFSIAPIVWKAFVNLIVKAVTSPFSLLGAIFGIDEDKLKGVEFEYGKSNIIASEKESLDAIAKILKDRTKLALKIEPFYDPDKDKLALQNLKIDKIVEQKIKSLPNGNGDTYKKALEDLYANEKMDKTLEEIKKSFTQTNGKTEFDNEAYSNYLKNALALKQEIKKEELISLANSRITNIKEYLLKKEVPENSLKIEQIKEQKTDKSKWVQFKFEVSTR